MSDAYDLIALKDARPGLVLGHELLDNNGLLLLAGGAVLTEAIIASLGRHGVEAVPVARADPAPAPDPAAVQARLDHLFRKHEREDHADWATGLLRRYIEDYRLGREVAR